MGKLTDKQRAFIAAYIACGWNATEAARQAGYASPMQEGWRLLRNAEIDAAISAALDAAAMPANEVLARLADHARGTMDDFLDDDGRINLPKARAAGKLHLVKSRSTTKDGDRIDLYDAQAALTILAKHHGLLVDRSEVSGPGGAPLLPPIREVVVRRPDASVEPDV